MPAVDLANPLGDVVEEVAVVRDGENGTRVLVEELLEPQHRLGVEMVGRLVQKQQVRSLKQQTAQRHAPTFAARENVHRHIGVGALQRIHRLGKLAVQIPSVDRVNRVLQLAHFRHERVEVGIGLGHEAADLVETVDLRLHVAERELDVAEHSLVLVERRLLLQDADGVAGRQARLAVGHFLKPRHQLQQRGLSHAVRADDADFRAGVERQRDVVEDYLVAMRLARLVHLVNEFGHSIVSLSSPAISSRFQLNLHSWGKFRGKIPAGKSLHRAISNSKSNRYISSDHVHMALIVPRETALKLAIR